MTVSYSIPGVWSSLASSLDLVGFAAAVHVGNDPQSKCFWSTVFPGGTCELLQFKRVCFMSDLTWCKQSADTVCVSAGESAIGIVLFYQGFKAVIKWT